MRNSTKKIIVHCSDSDYPHHDNPETIKKWHLERGFSDIGYHFVITKDGTIHHGRELNSIGAHCKGQNSTSIGVCLTGRKIFTKEQFLSLTKVCDAMKLLYGDLYILPHNYYDKNKTCPNFNLGLFSKPMIFRPED